MILYFFSFLEMRFSGVTLAIVSAVNTRLTDISVQSLSTSITTGGGA